MRTVASEGINTVTVHRGLTMKHFIIAVMIAALAGIATNARANNITADIDPIGGTAIFGALHTDSSPFMDTFNFNVIGSVLASGSLISIDLTPGNNIDFTSANLNGTAYSFPFSGFIEIGGFLPTSFTGPLILTVFGTTDAGGGVNASYSGTLNVTSVPEPASLLLLGAGLAGIGVWRRWSMKI